MKREIEKTESHESEIFVMKENKDPDFINDDEIYKTVSGGHSFVKTFPTKKCNCGRFEGKLPGLNADYCENCIHARCNAENPAQVCCSVQAMRKSIIN